MISLDIRADVRQAERFLRNLKRIAVKRAASRAINDAAITVRAEGARAIKREHPALKIGDIKNNIARYRATPQNLRAELKVKGRPLSATLFALRGGQQRTRRSVGVRGQVSLTRMGRARPMTAMFGTRRELVQYHGRKGFRVLRYGNEVFVRSNATGRKLRRFRGPSLPGVFRSRSEEFKAIAAERWKVAFPNRLKFEIEQAKVSV